MHESTRVTVREASELSAPRPGRFGSVIAMAFDVATPVFDGPFDLLLRLILAEEVDIYQVSLSTIVDAYLVEVDGAGPRLDSRPVLLRRHARRVRAGPRTAGPTNPPRRGTCNVGERT